jgi:alkanesulfonate monooxygenase SsuD/methylene tetrahydromethanopterin reductase-like flavin-dependent oxidoreductase (luciferase family)
LKICMFHLMPYRDLPADFEQRYKSAFVDPLWFDIADSEKVGHYYNATLDELLYAADAGLHGLCTNQHHQNVYGFMANPSLMGSVLAKQTNGRNVAIIQLGSTLPSTTPPTRIAEEYAMLDCISGGRLVAGFPTGLPSDAVISNAVVPIEQRERYREALALVVKAWSAREIFAWNGKHYQLGMVNLWPRPIQQPHPPIWIPGSGITATAEYVVGLDHCFCHLSYFGAKNAGEVADRYWELAARKGRDDNPFRFSFLQLIGVADSDAEAEDLYGPHAEYFFNKLLHTPPYYQQVPGCLEYPALLQAARHNPRAAIDLRNLKAKDFFRRGFVIVGSPRTVREQLMDGVKRLRIGHLLALLHFGSMPTDLCKRNIDLFAREVMPHLGDLWDDAYEDRWWPERLRAKRPVRAGTAAS